MFLLAPVLELGATVYMDFLCHLLKGNNELAKRFIWILRGKTRMTLLANPIYSQAEDNRPKDPDLFEF